MVSSPPEPARQEEDGDDTNRMTEERNSPEVETPPVAMEQETTTEMTTTSPPPPAAPISSTVDRSNSLQFVSISVLLRTFLPSPFALGLAAQVLEEEIRRLKEARLCKVCLDEEVSIAYIPCGTDTS